MHPGKVVQGGVVTAYGDVCMALAAHTLFDHGEVSLDLVHHRQLPRARDRITVHRAADGASWDWEFDGVVDVEALVAKASPESTGLRFWIDRTKRVASVFLSQVLPFYDHTAIDLFGKFETEVYRAI